MAHSLPVIDLKDPELPAKLLAAISGEGPGVGRGCCGCNISVSVILLRTLGAALKENQKDTTYLLGSFFV